MLLFCLTWHDVKYSCESLLRLTWHDVKYSCESLRRLRQRLLLIGHSVLHSTLRVTTAAVAGDVVRLLHYIFLQLVQVVVLALERLNITQKTCSLV